MENVIEEKSNSGLTKAKILSLSGIVIFFGGYLHALITQHDISGGGFLRSIIIFCLWSFYLSVPGLILILIGLYLSKPVSAFWWIMKWIFLVVFASPVVLIVYALANYKP